MLPLDNPCLSLIFRLSLKMIWNLVQRQQHIQQGGQHHIQQVCRNDKVILIIFHNFTDWQILPGKLAKKILRKNTQHIFRLCTNYFTTNQCNMMKRLAISQNMCCFYKECRYEKRSIRPPSLKGNILYNFINTFSCKSNFCKKNKLEFGRKQIKNILKLESSKTKH